MIDTKGLAESARALSKPLVKLLEVIESGLGAIGRPLMVVVNEHASGRARLIRANYQHKLALLEAAQRREFELAALAETPRLPSAADSPGVAEVVEESSQSESVAARGMFTRQLEKRRANLVTIAAEAADCIGNEVSDVPVDPDWTARFFDYAQDVSSEELQKLWGSLLAGEVQRPGQIPLRTLEILRNLTVREAETMGRFASRLSIDGVYLPYGNGALSSYEIRMLQDAGVVEERWRHLPWHEPGGRSQDFEPFNEPPGTALLCYRSRQTLEVRARNCTYLVDAFMVRPSAVPLLQVIDSPTDAEYLKGLVDHFTAGKDFGATLRLPAETS